jgi:hypothetical protein
MDHETRWNTKYQLLLDYTTQHGNALVGTKYVHHTPTGEVPLGHWVSNQRVKYRAGKLSPERAALLAGLPGWNWGPLLRGRRSKPERDAQVRDLRTQGLSLAQIADRMGVTRQRIHQILRRQETSAAPVSEPTPSPAPAEDVSWETVSPW